MTFPTIKTQGHNCSPTARSWGEFFQPRFSRRPGDFGNYSIMTFQSFDDDRPAEVILPIVWVDLSPCVCVGLRVLVSVCVCGCLCVCVCMCWPFWKSLCIFNVVVVVMNVDALNWFPREQSNSKPVQETYSQTS